MGCKESKLDRQPPVALCRSRTALLRAAVRHRSALADAHLALSGSLLSFSSSLQSFLSHASSHAAVILPLPSPRKLPRRALPDLLQTHRGNDGGDGYCTETSYSVHYARSRPPPASVVVSELLLDAEAAFIASGFTDTYYDFHGHTYTHQYGMAPSASAAPQHPPPPSGDPWDIFNVFPSYGAYDGSFYQQYTDVYSNPYAYSADANAFTAAYTPSRSSKEVREEEGIPDLEEDGDEVVDGDQADDEHDKCNIVKPPSPELNENLQVDAGKNVRHKEVIIPKEARRPQPSRAAVSKNMDLADIGNEIKLQFERAVEAAAEVGVMLEVGKDTHGITNSIYEVSSKMAALAITRRHDEVTAIGEERVVGAGGLAMTLQKLYIWESKLYEEVKAEEKMRLLLAKNSRRLRLLDQKGAEPQKIEDTRNLIKKLSTKIRIAIQVVDSMSHKITKLRDEELYPQIDSLIQGFIQMWHGMLDSYHAQAQLIAKHHLNSIATSKRKGDLALELELELMKWSVNFFSWVSAQKNLAKVLNGWLALCLNYTTEVTAGGIAPYSPRKLGAPPLFIICKSWSEAMETVSAKEAMSSLQSLAASLRHLWEQEGPEQSEQIVANREREKWVKSLEKKMQEVNKEVGSLNRKLAVIPGQQIDLDLYDPSLDDASGLDSGSLQTALTQVFESLENFSASSLHAFHELYEHVEERAARANAKVP